MYTAIHNTSAPVFCLPRSDYLLACRRRGDLLGLCGPYSDPVGIRGLGFFVVDFNPIISPVPLSVFSAIASA